MSNDLDVHLIGNSTIRSVKPSAKQWLILILNKLKRTLAKFKFKLYNSKF